MSDVTSILSQIRSYQHQMGTRALEPNPGAFAPNRVGLEQPGVKAPSFGETLQNALEGVNGAQKNAGALAQAFELGDPRADLAR